MPAPDLPLSAAQLDSVRESNGRVNIWDGSIRSGKTIGSILRWLMFVALAPRGGELVMIGRTRDTVWRNVIGPMQDPSLFGPAAATVVGNYGAPTVTILGRRVYVLGAHDAKAEKTIRGLTVAGAYVDEVTTLTEEFFTQLLGRMSVAGAQLFGTTNPDSPGHWLKRKFLDRLGSLPDWRRFHFTIEDNPSLTAAYVESIRREFTGLWFRRFILGEWVQAEGAIYDMWDPDRHVVPHATLPPMERVLAVGVDYGTTNPTRGYLLGYAAERLWVLDEWAPTGGTDAELSHSLTRWLNGRQPAEWRDPEWLFIDPAAASFKLQLRRDGHHNTRGGANEVLPGIRTIGSLLALERLKVSDRCEKLIDRVPGYAWDPKKTEKGEDAPLKVDDHEADALRYAVHSTRRLWRNLIPLTASLDDDPELEEAA
ncbi:PBSX family phage terminase large subunit [Aeromicrobium phragmitis]|uniref:PBSX family phage terminase large subunit n=1 Tax=Aeromicrobium phragmitis TaxID=2478914 RepID=A0A3L8PMQ8_9ACTN|nr:PBSX family phage terminase large subunit [Aeromicrobium phragmitis]RLV56049.1 PBSX family phage terminase large subunit [Aeromicrobium phragmitis]